MARVAGRLSTLDVSTDGGTTYTAVGCIQDATLNGEGEEIDVTCHDDGVFRAFLAGRGAYTIDLTCIWDEADAGQGILETAHFNRSIYDFRWRQQVASGLREYTAQGLVTAFTPGGPNDDAAGLDISIRLTGTVTRAAQS